MQSERWRTATDIFHAALDRAPDERSAFLEQSCAGDDVLRQKVETLLRYHDEAGDFIASPAFSDAPELLTGDPDALIGQHLGSYRIDGVLGAGGMGLVYLAYDERLGRKVGLKLLPRALVNDPSQLERLKLEARTASALNHPNIVTVHEIGQVDSTHYLAIEFIEGITVRERIARGAVPPAEAIEIATQAANALCVAHRAGIVHRDIKPENIMIRPDGYVKVLDFGIAKSTQGEITGGATLLSSAGHPKGSAAILDKLLVNDPMLPNALLWQGWAHLQLGAIDEAERSIRRAADAGLTSVGLAYAHVAQARGDNAALIEWLARGLRPFMRDLPSGMSRVIADGTVGSPAQRAQAIAIIEDYLAKQPPVISGAIPLALIWFPAP